jgi:N5-hydroxyornithine acetyltransferase
MALPALASFTERYSDVDILHRWMNEPRVNAAWGCAGPVYTQQKFLEDGLSSAHSFPVIGCWDGKPFGYFEIYWVKEDKLGRLLGGQPGNYDRGLHVLVGEQEFRGPHRIKIWMDALVHYCWLSDPRTESVILEPRVDNQK